MKHLVLALAISTGVQTPQAPPEQTTAKLSDPSQKIRVEGMRELRERVENARHDRVSHNVHASNVSEAAKLIAPLLNDPVDAVQVEAISTEVGLFLAEVPEGRRYKAGIVEVRNRSGVQAAFEAGPSATSAQEIPVEVIKGLTAAMGDTSGRVRFDATYAFGTLARHALTKAEIADVKPGIDVLRASLNDATSDVRVAAARVLGRVFGAFGPSCAGRCVELGGVEVGDALIDAMNDRSGAVRAAAMEALGATRNERAIKALEERFTFHGRGDEAESALDALARIGNPASVPLFKSLLQSTDADVQRMAIEGVARAGAKEMALEIEDLPRATRAEETMIAVTFALHVLGRGDHVRTLHGAALVSTTAAQARGYLVELGSTVAPGLYAYLLEADPRVKIFTADLLGELGNTGAIERLKPLMADRDPQVAAAARRAIARLEG